MQWFDTVDESRDGKIDVKELQRALQMGNLNFSLQAVAQMIRCAHRSVAHLRQLLYSGQFSFQRLVKIVVNILDALKAVSKQSIRSRHTSQCRLHTCMNDAEYLRIEVNRVSMPCSV
jgi:hypothetical protein